MTLLRDTVEGKTGIYIYIYSENKRGEKFLALEMDETMRL